MMQPKGYICSIWFLHDNAFVLFHSLPFCNIFHISLVKMEFQLCHCNVYLEYAWNWGGWPVVIPYLDSMQKYYPRASLLILATVFDPCSSKRFLQKCIPYLTCRTALKAHPYFLRDRSRCILFLKSSAVQILVYHFPGPRFWSVVFRLHLSIALC